MFCIISSIRRKLRKVTKKEYIQTVWGAGYKFVDVPGE
ncbi:winged helix-turn-helix domain-containing protein [Lachnoclostridium sp. An118]